MSQFMQLPPGKTVIRLLPPIGEKWDYPHLRFARRTPEVKHPSEKWKDCPFCVHEAAAGLVAFIQFVVRG